MSTLSGNDTVLFGPEPNPGDRLGNYILDRKLGSGGMGHVWKAIHEPTGKPYAIKLLPPIIASNPDAWDQVRRNFDIIENLNHPHICAVKVLDRDAKYGPYLVMAHVEGMTLNKYRQGRTFTPEQVAALLKPVAEALDFAHSRKVIHRDIKHENIMVVVADDGQTIVDTYVIDFGLAAESRTVVTQFSQQSAPLAGTLRYMAPELWRGRPPVPASDQYALAVIAYELLAGYFPIDGVDRGIMREAVLNEAVEAITNQSAAVNDAMQKALSKNSDDRFTTCSTMLTHIAANDWSESGVNGLATHSGVNALDEFIGARAGDLRSFGVDGIYFSLRWCPPGTFIMGAPRHDRFSSQDNMQVTIELTKGYWIGETQVTQELYEAIMSSNPSHTKGAQHPVETDWNSAMSFSARLSQRLQASLAIRPHWRFQIPSEAQWEYACRAGTTTSFCWGNDEGQAAKYAHCITGFLSIFTSNGTRPVKSKMPNAWGIYDMHGNVWEWCSNWYSERLVAGRDPTGPVVGSEKVLRGGSYTMQAFSCASAIRNKWPPSYLGQEGGFRIVLVSNHP